MNKLPFGKYWLWILLALPALLMLFGLVSGRVDSLHRLLHPTGEFSARFLIIALIATPLLVLFPKGIVSRWLVRNRRYFGVASFAYALLHLLFYLIDEGWAEAAEEFLGIGILTGWLAFFIFVPLALTSNDAAMRRMGTAWKRLQRWVYLAAILTFAHWVFIEYHWKPALVHFVPVLLLQLVRIVKVRRAAVAD